MINAYVDVDENADGEVKDVEDAEDVFQGSRIYLRRRHGRQRHGRRWLSGLRHKVYNGG